MNTHPPLKTSICLLGLLIPSLSLPIRASDSLTHVFQGGINDGASPSGDVVVSDGVLYGMTGSGGANSDSGVVYRLDADGSGFALLTSLPNGSSPSGSLALGGSTLYGMTSGINGFGTIFEIGTNGAGYQVLHNFTGGIGDGRNALGTLLLSGSTLYGMTQRGGSLNDGVIFSMNTDGTGFNPMHSFLGGSDGSLPVGALTLDGSTLYGMTSSGAVFKIGTDGSDFTVLQNIGGNPQGSLIVVDSTLYGTTSSGGSGGAGTIFQIGVDGTGYQVLHDFTGDADDGSLPSGALTLVGSTLYGTTQSGGEFGFGTVFQMDLDGDAFGLVHSFTGGVADGASPQGSLVLSGGLLYGTTAGGGATNNGTIFTVAVPEPSQFALVIFAAGQIVIFHLRKNARRRAAPAKARV